MIEPPWHGKLLVAPGHAFYVGPAGGTRPHQHHALQVTIALEGPFEAEVGDDEPRPYEALVIAPDRPHRIDARGQPVAIYYIDPECARPRPTPEDPAVRSAILLLEQSLPASPSVPALAGLLGLRQRELSARFRTQTGLTIRGYVLWLRIREAISALGEKQTLTGAAHSAGFADAAHLSRTFVSMFGVPPSESVAASEIEIRSGT